MADKKIKIKQIKSTIGVGTKQTKIIRALGFTKKDQIVEHNANDTISGMIKKVSHLVQVVE